MIRISKFESALQVRDGRVDWSRSIRLAVGFEDGSRLCLRIGEDGATLLVAHEELEPAFDLGEFGRFGTHELADRLDPTLRDAVVGAPISIRDRAGRLVGMALPRPGAEAFCIWVDRHQFYWGAETQLAAHEWPAGMMPLQNPLSQSTDELVTAPNLDLCAPLP